MSGARHPRGAHSRHRQGRFLLMATISKLMITAVGFLVAAEATPARAAIVRGQVDDFEDGILGGWQNGGNTNPNPAANVASGGPAGATDNFMRITADGSGAGGKLVAFNTAQWAGDYLGVGVDAIRMQLNNTGATGLSVRLILADGVDGQSLTTSSPVNVPAGSGWVTAS